MDQNVNIATGTADSCVQHDSNPVDNKRVYQWGGAGVASTGLWGCRVDRTQRSLGDRSRLSRSLWNG